MNIAELWRRVRGWLRRDRMLAELEEEMRLHVELRAQQLQAVGDPSPVSAARRRFGNEARWVERSREEWIGMRLDSLVHDLRHAAKSLRKSGGLSVAIVLTLAVTIGASTAIFGVVYRLYLQPLSLPHAAQLAAVVPFNRGNLQLVSRSEYESLAAAPGVPDLAAYFFSPLIVETAGRRDDVWGDFVSRNYFTVLQAEPIAGRGITPADVDGHAAVAVISSELARAHFGGAREAIGKAIRVDGQPFTVVGVMPQTYTGVHFARRFAVVLPLTMAGQLKVYTADRGWQLLTRLSSRERARAATAIDEAYRRCCAAAVRAGSGAEEAAGVKTLAHPATEGPTGTSRVTSARRDVHATLADASRGLAWGIDYRKQYAAVLSTVGAGVVILLLIACANIATLLLARAVAHEREHAVRRAIGAGTGRLVRQLVLEATLLGVGGATCGFFLAGVAAPLFAHTVPQRAAALRLSLDTSATLPMIVIVTTCTVVCVLLFGLWPALQSTKVDIARALSARRMSGWRPLRGGRGLVVGQVALAVVLVCSATLFAATVHNLLQTEIAAATPHLVFARVDAGDTEFRDVGLAPLSERLQTAVATVPGVVAVAADMDAPLIMDKITSGRLDPPVGQSDPEWRSPVPLRVNAITSGYFGVTGMAIRSGREFNASDRADSAPVAIVSEQFARIYFADSNPVGQIVRMRPRAGPVDIRIVGLVADVPYEEPRAGTPAVWYMPMSQADRFGLTNFGEHASVNLIVRTHERAEQTVGALRVPLQSAVAGLRIQRLSTAEEVLNDAIGRERFAATLATVFGLVAVLLAAAGVYALLSHTTARRTREMGVRLALGATPRGAATLVLRQSTLLALTGITIGAILMTALTRTVRSQLFGVNAAEWMHVAAGAFLMVFITIVATLGPALRAARVHPLEALRSD